MKNNKTEKTSKKKDSKFVKKIKQNMYKWHRTIGIITIIPVIFWTLSGLMHPFMAHFFKPEITHDKLELKPIDKSRMQFSLQQALDKNGISEFKNFRIISFNDATYYQVKNTKDELVYLNTANAKPLINGDKQYAQWLSRYFLDDQKSAITNTELVTEFTTQYKYVNRYLPVYKLSFDRPDGMQVYVETASGKLATFNPNSRQFFVWFFDTFHNWSFIDAIANNGLRITIMILLLFIITTSALSGILIYGFMWKKFKKAKSVKPQNGIQKYHRQIGIWISIFTLTFAFSGAFHATKKWEPYTLDKKIYEPVIKSKNIAIPSNNIAVDWNKLEEMNIISFNDSLFYRCQMALPKTAEEHSQKDDQKSKWDKKENPKSEVVYINTTTNKSVPDMDFRYAEFLAYYFNNKETKASCCEMGDDSEDNNCNIDKADLKEVSLLTDFDNREYGFVNKRLPVVKLVFDTPDNKACYIETSTSRLAAVVTSPDRTEGYSFAIFHKFLFMDWAGKNIRDLSMVFAALSILVVSILGLILFLRKK